MTVHRRWSLAAPGTYARLSEAPDLSRKPPRMKFAWHPSLKAPLVTNHLLEASHAKPPLYKVEAIKGPMNSKIFIDVQQPAPLTRYHTKLRT